VGGKEEEREEKQCAKKCQRGLRYGKGDLGEIGLNGMSLCLLG